METLIVIPNTGNLRKELVEWLLTVGNNYKAEFYLPHNRPIDCSRNQIVNYFLTTDAKWLLMIDSDVVPPYNILDMIKNDVPVCSAWVNTKKDNEVVPMALDKVEGGYKVKKELEANKPTEVDCIGTGAILIKREVLEKMKQPCFEFRKKENGELALGEDFDFSEKVRALGFKIYFDARYKCNHLTVGCF